RPAVPGVTRPDIPTFSVEVGSTLLKAMSQLVEEGYIHWHVQPGSWYLDMYRGLAPASPTPAATLDGTNLTSLERKATAPYANSLLVQWEGGYTRVTDAAAVSAFGTVVSDILSTD